jgi:hypothetical protein
LLLHERKAKISKQTKKAETVAVDNIGVKPITPQQPPYFDSRITAGIHIERWQEIILIR